MPRDVPKLFCHLYKRNWKITRQKRHKGMDGKTERRGNKELFPPSVIIQYSGWMLPSPTIIINYTQERESQDSGKRRGRINGLCSQTQVWRAKRETPHVQTSSFLHCTWFCGVKKKTKDILMSKYFTYRQKTYKNINDQSKSNISCYLSHIYTTSL